MGEYVYAERELSKSKESPSIYRFKDSSISVQNSNQNQTYVLDGKQISGSFIKQVYIELEIETPLNTNNSILFAIKKEKALYYNEDNGSYNAEYIDTRGYYMNKQYYRIELLIDENIKENDQFYVTIFQNTLHPQELRYTLKIIVVKQLDVNEELQKPCPFNCLDRGQCNKKEGLCQCNIGYLDYDCSKKSTSLSNFNNLSLANQEVFGQQSLEFDQLAKRNGKFYHLYDHQLDGYLYLQIDLSDELKINQSNQNSKFSKTFLEVYYTLETQSLKGIGVADRKFAKISQKINIDELANSKEGYEIFIDQFNKKESSNSIEIISEQLLLLFGFRLNENDNSGDQVMKFKFQLILKDQPTHLENKSSTLAAFIKNNQTITLLVFVLFFLIIVLVGLLVYIKKNTAIIQSSQQQHLAHINKKLQKQEEFKKIFDLILSFPFNEENKRKYWPNFKSQSEIEGDRQVTHSEQPSCSICLCEFDLEEEVRVTYCAHYFHSDCLREWLKKQKNCPNCRNDLTEPSLQSKKKSPSTFLRQIFKNRLSSPNLDRKKQKEGYDKQIDDQVIQLEPLGSAVQISSEKMQQKLGEQINLQTQTTQIKEQKFKSTENIYKSQGDKTKSRKLVTQSSIKHNSLTELDESQDKNKTDISLRPHSRKLIKLDSIDSPSPIGISKFSIRNEQLIKKSILKEINE